MLLEIFMHYGTKEKESEDFTTDILCRSFVTIPSLYSIEAVMVAFLSVGGIYVLREDG